MANSFTCWLSIGVMAVAIHGLAAAEETEPAFRTDVSMGRLDVQALDGRYQTIPNFLADDFILRHNGTPIPIRGFSYEQLPVDVLLLLDTSGSMREHVQRVASAAHRALAILGPEDHVGIMVFTTRTKVPLKLGPNRAEVESKLNEIVGRSFGGGTDINRALLDAAAYIGREGRKEARHAIVIVTDDMAKPCDRERVSVALSEADAVLMALLTPKAEDPWGSPGGSSGGSPPVLRTPPWPGPGGGGPLGGVIWGRRRGPGVPRSGGPPWGGPGTPYEDMSAGTAAIADESGGESLASSAALALETAFARIRQQYTMYFYLPEGLEPSDASSVQVDLTNAARHRHPDTELRYRQIYLSGSVKRTFVTRVPRRPPEGREDPVPTTPATVSAGRRRIAVDETTGSRVTISPIEKRRDATPAADPLPDPVETAGTDDPKPRRPAVSEPRGPRINTIPPN